MLIANASKEEKDEEITHLFFADDILIFFVARRENLEYLGWILMWFEVLLGLKVSLEKKEVIPIGEL